MAAETTPPPTLNDRVCHTLRMAGLEDGIAQRIRQEAYPGYDPARSDHLKQYAEHQTDAGTHYPLETEKYLSDGWLVADAEAAREMRAPARETLESCQRLVIEAEKRYNEAPAGLKRSTILLAILVAVLVSAAAVMATRWLFSVTLDAAALRGWADDLAGRSAGKQLSATIALDVATWASILVYGALALVVVFSSGRVGWTLKLTYLVAVDVAFGVSLGALRYSLSEGNHGAGFLGWILFELSCALAHGLALWGTGTTLARERALADEKREREAALLAARLGLEVAKATREEKEAKAKDLGQDVADRDDAARRRRALIGLAGLSAEEAYITTSAVLIAEHAANPANDLMAASVESELTANHVRHEAVTGLRRRDA